MPKQNKSFLQYAGLATQLFVALGLGVYLGIKVDHWAHLTTPIATWLLPLVILVGMLVLLVRDTGTGK
jgi:F0F1-type ATP synthase assembly protein I